MKAPDRFQAMNARAAAAQVGAHALINTLARAAFQQMWEAIAKDPAKTPRAAILAVQVQFGGAFAAALANAFQELLQRSIGISEVRAMPVSGLTLSRRLYLHNVQTAAEVLALVRQHVQGVQQARQLARDLYDGYAPQAGVKRPLEGRARAALPRSLRAITDDLTARRELGALMVRGQQQAARLKSAALRAAYLEAFEAWKQGAGLEALRKRLDIAQREKNRFMADRVAQTEIHRAHQAQVARELMADVETTVVLFRINPTHPRQDICFRSGSPILTARGQVPIEAVSVGDAVLTHLGRWRTVTRLYRSPIPHGGTLLELLARTESGECLQATMTPNHPVRVPGGWTRASDLRTGSPVATASGSTYYHPPGGGAGDKGPSGFRGSSPVTAHGTAFLRRCGELLWPPRCRTSRNGARCVGAPSALRSLAARTLPLQALHLASSGCQHLVALAIDAFETLPSAETCPVDGCQNLGSLGQRVVGISGSKRYAPGQQERTAYDTSGTPSFCTALSNTSAPERPSGMWTSTNDIASEALRNSLVRDGVIVEIRQVESHGEDVFNLEVDEDHSYVAGGIVVHNCDLYGRADLYGLGPGLYPKEQAPRPPLHPFCRCVLRSKPSMTAAGAARVPMGEAAYLRGLGDDQAARVMGSAERAQRVLSGVPAETVINGGKDPLYHLVRVGQPQAQQHALAPKVQQPSETFGPYDPGAPRSVPDTSTPARRVVTKIEDQIRGDALETAAIVLPGTGSPSRTAL